MKNALEKFLAAIALASTLSAVGCAAPAMNVRTARPTADHDPAVLVPMIDDRPSSPPADDGWWRAGALAVVVPVALTVFIAGGFD